MSTKATRMERSPNGCQRSEWKTRLNPAERALIEAARAQLGGVSNGQLLLEATRSLLFHTEPSKGEP